MTPIGRNDSVRRVRYTTTLGLIVAMFAAVLAVAPLDAGAQGPPYAGPQTGPTGPAYFGPAPNPVPYCESPTYFDPFPENVTPAGRLDPGGGPDASVTTDGITMDFEVTAEGAPGTQYPGFFPAGGEGVANDQPKGVEMAAGDQATISLSAPLFYSQWVFTDVDRENEGFFVRPAWTDPQAEIAMFGGDANFTFSGDRTEVLFNDTDTVGLDSENIGGRVQVDLLGAVTGIEIQRDTGSGQSGFAVGGGCEAAGASKALVAGPTWNGSSFDVTFDLRIRNNLPSASTVAAAILAAQGAAPSDFLTAAPGGIPLESLQLIEPLGDSAFSTIEIVSVDNPGQSLPLNPGYNGITDTNVLAPGATLAAETNQLVTLTVRYTPDLAQAAWGDCVAGYTYLNQATVSATAANVAVTDQSDDGVDPAPGNDNGAGGVDDVTPVVFPCPPADLDIVKTVVPGPAGTCPDFAGGVVGDGPALAVTDQDTVTYCISVANPGTSDAESVVVSDPQNPAGDVAIGTIAGGGEVTTSFDVQVDLSTPTINTATAQGLAPDGSSLGPVSDRAVIQVAALPEPALAIVKTVIDGPGGLCPTFNDGIDGVGPALNVRDGETVTYCLAVRNTGAGDATNVAITDAQAPAEFDGSIGALAAGATASTSFDLTVALDTPVLNTATVTGDGPYGAVAPDSDDALLLISAQPDPVVQIVKTALAGPAATCPAFADGVIGAGAALPVVYGETVTYCISVRNIGGNAASDVVITDAQAPASFDGTVGTLAIGEEVTRSYDLAIDASTPALNTARVDGTGPNGALPSDTDQAVIDATPQPDPVLQIVKTVVPGPAGTCPASFEDGVEGLGPVLPAVIGQSVTYCLAVRNAAGSPATNVLITDPQAPAGFDGLIGDLAVGAEAARSFDLVVEASTPMVNTAAVGGSGPNGPAPDDTDQAQIEPTAAPQPRLEIIKTVVRGPDGRCPDYDNGIQGFGPALPVLFGETVTYCLTVKNLGLADATGVLIRDAQAPAGFDGAVGPLAINAEATRSFDLVVDENTPEANTALVSGNGPDGPVPGDSDTALIASSPLLLPDLKIVKTVIAGPGGDCPAFEDGVIGLGPGLEVMITDSVTYCISVRNVGPGLATDVVVNDPQAPGEITVGALAAGQTFDTSYDVVVNDRTPLVNIAVASGQGADGTVSAQDGAQIIATAQLIPSVTLTNTVVRTDRACDTAVESVDELVIGELDETVRWCFEVTNTGNTALTDLTFHDTPLGISDLDLLAAHGNGAASLPPGASIVFGVEGTIPDNGLASVSTVIGTPSEADGTPIAGLGLVRDDNSAEVLEAGIVLSKLVQAGADADCGGAADSVSVNTGAAVTWCFVITNTGAVTLVVEEVVDDVLDLAIPVPEVQQTLPAGATLVVATTTTADDDITNLATVTGVPVDASGTAYPDTPVLDDSDAASVDTLRADLAISKSVAPGGAVEPGAVLTYTLVITNLGPDPAVDVDITDELPAGMSYEERPDTDGVACTVAIADDFANGVSTESLVCAVAAPLTPDDEITLTYTARVSSSAAGGASFTNEAVVSSSTPDPDPDNNRDDASTSTVVPPPPSDPPPVGVEYPGPFEPVVPEEEDEPDEVLELVITGAQSRLLIMLSALLMMAGGVLNVGSRRRRFDI